MGQIFGWIGSHWWLIFLLPVFGGIIRATFGWDQRSRKRAERGRGDDYSTLRGNGPQPISQTGPDLSAAYQAAHQQATQYQQPNQQPKSQRPSEAERLVTDHDAVNARWLDYELDVAKLIDYPMMSDVREPLTVDFLRAKRLADGLRPEHASEISTEAQLIEYRQAVRNFEVSFDIAEREAKRLKDQHFTEPERQRLKTAKKLLPIAVDEASTPAERQLAYERTRKELDGLIVLPDEALAALEKRVQAGITAARSAATQAKPSGAAGAAEKER
ncbi:hypothetical protein [Psychromicrobium lacuslunae]|uniref:hypothetical protein n=1 Tax=Psychromicrobium lacuslunae TaxID=1618207 RepID=UPI0005D3C7B8|nr:hypothetical protein [Psychromicrobium lacuslunae]